MLKTREEIEEYMERFGGMDDWTINERMEVDWIYDVKLKANFFPDGKFPFQFGTVRGDFDCSHAGIASLVGAPHTVGGFFDCSKNRLLSLFGAPKNVSRDFLCSDNQLTTLQGAPQSVDGFFDCSSNQLTNLSGAPVFIKDSMFCTRNKILTIADADLKIGGNFYSSIILELESVAESFYGMGNEILYQVTGEDFNAKLNELKRVRDEKAQLETQLAKLVVPYDREKEGPLPSEKANKPKMKHKI
jgi:hypothetical protein